MLPILRGPVRIVAVLLTVAILATACASGSNAESGRATIVVTYAVLGAVVRELVGGAADVTVLIPNGADPHEWEASARDIAAVNHADLIVRNGLDLEAGIDDALDRAESRGVPTFTASDHITVRTVGEGQAEAGADDPHLWMDPVTMKGVVAALAAELPREGIEVDATVDRVLAELDGLDVQVRQILAAVPPESRKLVTGHESLGYFAARYGFDLVGAVIPSLTTQAGASAGALADLSRKVRDEHVKAVFVEIGTPRQVVDAVAGETGVEVVDLASHNLPADGRYSTFILDDARKIAAALG